MKTKRGSVCMKTIKTVVSGVAFLLVLLIAVMAVQSSFGIDTSRAFLTHQGLKMEKRDSLDAVFIGASNVHAFWQPMYAWADQGIAVYNYSIDSLPIVAVKYLVEEARKTQPNALFIINLSTFKRKGAKDTIENMHRLVDYMPLSLNKIHLINDMAKSSDLSWSEKLELFFPIIRFHSRWDELSGWAYGVKLIDYKCSMKTIRFLENCEDISGQFKFYDTRTEPAEDTMAVFTELLDYLEKKKLNVLFVSVPQVSSKTFQGHMNTLEDMVIERGFPCLDYYEEFNETGLDLRMDYYDTKHTNVHGSMKFTHCLGNYLIEHYGFVDKRGGKGWESWDELVDPYINLIGKHTLPFERENAARFVSDVPTLKGMTAEAQSITVSWEPVEEVDGYEIYRKNPKENKGKWHLVGDIVAEVDEETDNGSVIEREEEDNSMKYLDSNLRSSSEYTYTVVPYRAVDGKKLYGSFNVNGKSGKTQNGKQTETNADSSIGGN